MQSLAVYPPSNLGIRYTATMDAISQINKDSTSAELMLAYASGNAKAFNQLYLLHKAPMFRFILRQGIADSKADELFQEIWLKVIKARHNYQPSAKFQTWLYRIARNHLIDDFRRSGQSQFMTLIDEETADATHPSPEESIDVERKNMDLLQLINDLPFEQRQAFILRQEAGMSNSDIAFVTGTSPETAKSRVRYAIKQLKKQWERSP